MHHWQDHILAISFLMFNVALLPSVFSKHKPALSTSILTFVFLIPGLFVYISLSLWYSTLMTAINISLWGVLGAQRYLINKKIKADPYKKNRRSTK
jgi:hypothetical protein